VAACVVGVGDIEPHAHADRFLGRNHCERAAATAGKKPADGLFFASWN